MKNLSVMVLAVLVSVLNMGTVNAEQKTQTHTYDVPGQYTATVTVTDEFGAQTTQSVVVNVRGNAAPVVTIVANPTSGVFPLTVSFTATANDPDNDNMTYEWNFGDGSPVAAIEKVQHTYAMPGTYVPTFKATDTQGNVTQEQLSVKVQSSAGGCEKVS